MPECLSCHGIFEYVKCNIEICILFLNSGYYNNVIFHRVVPNFIVQGGDPTGTGEVGESVYGKPFKVGISFALWLAKSISVNRLIDKTNETDN